MKSNPNSLSLDVVERILFFLVLSYFVSNFLWLFVFGFYFWFLSFVVGSVTGVILLDRLVVSFAFPLGGLRSVMCYSTA